MYVCVSTTESEEGIGYPGTKVRCSCELPCKLLGIEPRTFVKGASTLNYQVISLDVPPPIIARIFLTHPEL